MISRYVNKLNSNISIITHLLINIFVFAVVSGLLFNDPFGTINGIGVIISNISDNGISGLICLLVIVIWNDYIYRGKK